MLVRFQTYMFALILAIIRPYCIQNRVLNTLIALFLSLGTERSGKPLEVLAFCYTSHCLASWVHSSLFMSSRVNIQHCLLAYKLFPLTSMAVTSTPICNTIKLSRLPVPLRITAQKFTTHCQCYLWQIKNLTLTKADKTSTLLLFYIETLKVVLVPALTESIHMSRFFVPRRQTKQSLPLWRAVHLYHRTCLLALSCPLLWSLHVPIARHPKHFYLYLPSSSSSILLLLPHPKAPST